MFHLNVSVVKGIQENLGRCNDNSSLLQKGIPDLLPPSRQMAIASQHFHGHGGDLQLQHFMLLITQMNSWRNEPNNLEVVLSAPTFLDYSIKPLVAHLFRVASLQFRLDTKYSPNTRSSQHILPVTDKSISTYT